MELRLIGVLEPDAGAISEGDLLGVLSAESAGEIKIAGQALGALLEGLEVPMDLDLDGDGTADAWQFVGSFTASRVELES